MKSSFVGVHWFVFDYFHTSLYFLLPSTTIQQYRFHLYCLGVSLARFDALPFSSVLLDFLGEKKRASSESCGGAFLVDLTSMVSAAEIPYRASPEWLWSFSRMILWRDEMIRSRICLVKNTYGGNIIGGGNCCTTRTGRFAGDWSEGVGFGGS